MVSLQNRLALGSGLLLRVQEESALESSKSGAGESGGALLRGVCRLCWRAVRKLGHQEMQQSWMETSPEEGTHPPRKPKAAGFIQGFQV